MALDITLLLAGVDHQIVQIIPLTDCSAGERTVYFAQNIVLRNHDLTVIQQHGTKCQREADIVILNKLSGFFFRLQFIAVGKEEVSIFRDIAGINVLTLKAAKFSFIGNNTILTVSVEVTGRSQNRIDTLCHFCGFELLVRAELATGQETAELGRMRNLYFRHGINTIVNNFLPGNNQNGFIVIVVDGISVPHRAVGRKGQLLSTQKFFRLFQNRFQFFEGIDLSVTGRIGFRSHLIMVRKPVNLLNLNG